MLLLRLFLQCTTLIILQTPFHCNFHPPLIWPIGIQICDSIINTPIPSTYISTHTLPSLCICFWYHIRDCLIHVQLIVCSARMHPRAHLMVNHYSAQSKPKYQANSIIIVYHFLWSNNVTCGKRRDSVLLHYTIGFRFQEMADANVHECACLYSQYITSTQAIEEPHK